MLFFPLLLHVHRYYLTCTNNHPYCSFITVSFSFLKTQLRYYLFQETFLWPKRFCSAFFFSCCDIVSILCNKSLIFFVFLFPIHIRLWISWEQVLQLISIILFLPLHYTKKPMLLRILEFSISIIYRYLYIYNVYLCNLFRFTMFGLISICFPDYSWIPFLFWPRWHYVLLGVLSLLISFYLSSFSGSSFLKGVQLLIFH